MSVNTEYYVIGRANNNNHPLLGWGQSSLPFNKGKPVQVTEPIKLVLGPPIPDHPVMADYHSLPRPVIGKKIKDVLEPLNIDGIQLVPAKVDARDKGLGVLDYWLVHVFNEIECMDKDKSISTYDSLGDASDIKKLVLSETELNPIPLDMRLIFRLAECSPTHLFHQSIVDKILAVKPEGVRFIRVDQWSHGSSFT